MQIKLIMPAPWQPGVQDICRVFFPGAHFPASEATETLPGLPPEAERSANPNTGSLPAGSPNLESDTCGLRLQIAPLPAGEHRTAVHLEGTLSTPALTIRDSARSSVEQNEDSANTARRLARLLTYRLLEKYCGSSPTPWGIFTGIRPTKVVHRLLDSGLSPQQAGRMLEQDYALSQEKIALLLEVTARQRAYLVPQALLRTVSIYIGIPFCPSRCLYCSFPSYSIKAASRYVEPFVSCLKREIEAVGRTLARLGVRVQTLYLGGGTPTSLAPTQLAEILELINRHLCPQGVEEFTVEGGRPETLTAEMLRLCRDAGANRLSINPQSMHEATLRAIGRGHSREDILRAVERARALGLPCLNMDVILGLPGEGVEQVRETVEQVLELQPENISVHTLALKRASLLMQSGGQTQLPASHTVQQMHSTTRHLLQEQGYIPYYLYRQKRILGQQENTGYTRPGHTCIYNIQIIEERQTVLGLGCGAGSKWVRYGDWYLTSTYSPKEPAVYIERIDQIIGRQVALLESHFGPAT
ncbi:MAG: coproporphyrinogen dehydrogenase HemZ [Desulfurispora sp.]|uniref:coproporphyrinogen dehydrogenase HemZ n=1 Tax=Desulfurispora sp. TaxID=3014275 RepID=UPI00404999E3